MNFDINNTALGKKSTTPETYDPTVLFRIPRSENRAKYDIQDSQLPFTGIDVWNCYEISFLTNNGFPVNRMMKLVYPCNSQYLVESKSLKLYLNSFNMERMGNTVKEAIENFSNTVKTDLQEILETELTVSVFNNDTEELKPFGQKRLPALESLIDAEEFSQTQFNHFLENPNLISGTESEEEHYFSFHTDLLRSNCRVTNQPDWGDLFVTIKSRYLISAVAMAAYLVSFRKENHFHEEVVEMIYSRLEKQFQPSELMVAAMYTRRGGIDINPIRCSNKCLIDPAFADTQKRLAKTLRQ